MSLSAYRPCDEILSSSPSSSIISGEGRHTGEDFSGACTRAKFAHVRVSRPRAAKGSHASVQMGGAGSAHLPKEGREGQRAGKSNKTQTVLIIHVRLAGGGKGKEDEGRKEETHQHVGGEIGRRMRAKD